MMTLKKLPEVDEYVKERFVNAVKKHHHGKKRGVLKEELQNALLFYIEMGPLADDGLVEDPTTGDVEKFKLTNTKFLQLFDNYKIGGNLPVYGISSGKIDVNVLKGIVEEITGKTSDYGWRNWSKLLKETCRIKQLNGTKYYLIIRDNFEFIDVDLKDQWNKQIEENKVYLNDSKSINECPTNKIYDKLTPGNKTSLSEICELGKIPENEGKKVIKKLEREHKLRMVGMGRWIVLDRKSVRNLKENPVSQITN